MNPKTKESIFITVLMTGITIVGVCVATLYYDGDIGKAVEGIVKSVIGGM